MSLSAAKLASSASHSDDVAERRQRLLKLVGLGAAGIAAGYLVYKLLSRDSNEDDAFEFSIDEARKTQNTKASEDAAKMIEAAKQQRLQMRLAKDEERKAMKAAVDSERQEMLTYAKMILEKRGLLELIEADAKRSIEKRAEAARRREERKNKAEAQEGMSKKAMKAAMDEAAAAAKKKDDVIPEFEDDVDEDEWEDASGSEDASDEEDVVYDDSSFDSQDSYETDAGLELVIANEYERELRGWIEELMDDVDPEPSAATMKALAKRRKYKEEQNELNKKGSGKRQTKKEKRKMNQKIAAETKIDSKEEELIDFCKQYVETLYTRQDMVERAEKEHNEEEAGRPFDPNIYHSDVEDDDDAGHWNAMFGEDHGDDEEDEEGEGMMRGSAGARADFSSEMAKIAKMMAQDNAHGNRPSDANPKNMSPEELYLMQMLMATGKGSGATPPAGTHGKKVSPTAYELHPGDDGYDDEDDWDDDDEDEDDMYFDPAGDHMRYNYPPFGEEDDDDEEDGWWDDDGDDDEETAAQREELHRMMAVLERERARAEQQQAAKKDSSDAKVREVLDEEIENASGDDEWEDASSEEEEVHQKPKKGGKKGKASKK